MNGLGFVAESLALVASCGYRDVDIVSAEDLHISTKASTRQYSTVFKLEGMVYVMIDNGKCSCIYFLAERKYVQHSGRSVDSRVAKLRDGLVRQEVRRGAPQPRIDE